MNEQNSNKGIKSDKVLSRLEFAKSQLISKEVRMSLNMASILGYICAGINILIGLGLKEPIVIISGLVMLLLVIGVHAFKSMICAIVFLVLSILNLAMTLIFYQEFGGWLIFVAGAYSVWAIGRLNGEYENFKYKLEHRLNEKSI